MRPESAASPAGVAEPGPAVAARARSAARPVRRSTERERAGFRSLVQPVWERHSASVNRAMTRMPVLRGAQVDAARTDLVAVHLYLSGGLAELAHRPGGQSPDELTGSYLACLASGLSRLPSYRGVAVRGGLPAGASARFVPGTLLREPAPVSALPIGVAGGLAGAAGGYVIWSSTGRRMRPLLGSGAGAALDEVVFPPGTVFRVLDVRSDGPAPVVMLSEQSSAGPGHGGRPGVLGDADRAALDRLDGALRGAKSPAGGASLSTWPARCAVPLFGAEAGEPPVPSAT